jgi:2-oxoglutarate dehydrogenase E2 component (dihydrolipoamide succinyltransferase)
MATEVVMPQMGESIAEGTITKWLVKAGDKVERDQPLFEISTDKVDAEIPSPAAGVILEIRHQEGATVPVSQVVALIGEAGEGGGAAPAAAAPAAPAQPGSARPEAARAQAQAKAANAAEVAPPAQAGGAAPAGGAQAAREESARGGGAAQPAPAPAPAAAPAAAPRPAAEPGSLEERVRKYSSPLVRKMAQAEGVDLEQLTGSGIHGRVTKADLDEYLEERKRRPAPAAAGPRPVPAPAPAAAAPASSAEGFHVPAYTEGEEVEIEPMSKIREITAAHMAYSKRTSAHVTTVFHIDMTRVTVIRNKVKDKFSAAHGTKLTYMPFIFAAVCAGLRKHKKLNAAIDGKNVVYKKHINLGMAVAMDRGLIVPVIQDADEKSLAGLAKAANDLADRARAKKLQPQEIKGGTFTITNPGVFGSLFGTPIINQPQVAILGIGTIEKRPIVVTDRDGIDSIAIRTMCYFGITYDHRLVDGADADHFMNDVKKVLEQGDWPELQPFL